MVALKFCQKSPPFSNTRSDPVCPVTAVLAYLMLRSKGPSPLFRFEDGRPLTRTWMVQEVKRGLKEAGTSSSVISGHSFRIRVATTAAEQGVAVLAIKDLGR